MYAAMIKAELRFLEPMFKVEIRCVDTQVAGCYKVLTGPTNNPIVRGSRRGVVISEESEGANDNGEEGSSTMRILKAFLPVSGSFGFTKDLRAKTQGKAFPTMLFDHW